MLKSSQALLALIVALAAPTAARADGAVLTRPQAYAHAAALEALGRKLFFDPALSASGQMACATCHDPAHGFSPANDRAVQRGGKDMARPGLRAVPSLTYLQAVPPFTEHYYDSDDEGDASIDNGPTGGLTWDGRMDRGRAQAAVSRSCRRSRWRMRTPPPWRSARASPVTTRSSRRSSAPTCLPIPTGLSPL